MTQHTLTVKVNTPLTKEDEIAALTKIMIFFAALPETYLHDLFSEAMLSEFTTRIHNDQPTDIAEALRELYHADRVDRADYDEVLRQRNDARIDLKNARREIGQLDEAIAHMTGEQRTASDQIIDLSAELIAAQNRELETAQALRERDAEVLRLKAELYDLITAAR